MEVGEFVVRWIAIPGATVLIIAVLINPYRRLVRPAKDAAREIANKEELTKEKELFEESMSKQYTKHPPHGG